MIYNQLLQFLSHTNASQHLHTLLTKQPDLLLDLPVSGHTSLLDQYDIVDLVCTAHGFHIIADISTGRNPYPSF